jgi:superfamily II DNA/RNA helicase
VGRTGRAGRPGTAISIVTSLDTKSMAAIERLIGQSIPRAEGNFEIRADASEDGERPREQRKREGSKEGSRGGRKPRREREPRHARGRTPASKPQTQVAAAPSSVPSIGRPEPKRASRDAEADQGDHSHLPAFLLRPVRARV